MTAGAVDFRLGFFGTPDFARVVLAAMIDRGTPPVVVFSQPPRPSGRGMVVQASAVEACAARHQIPTVTATDWRDPHGAARARRGESRLDLAVVVAYGKILPAEALAIPPLGFVNLHASLLPRWRGAAPIQRAILEGDAETGVCLMQMTSEFDAGAVLAQRSLAITDATTGGWLHDALAELSAELLLENLPRLRSRSLVGVAQPQAGICYAAKIERRTTQIDWSDSAAAILRQIRAFTPHPSAWSEIGGERIKILAAEVAAEAPPASVAGTLITDAPEVATGRGCVRLLTIQRAGRRPVSARDWVKSAGLLGQKFDAPEAL
ncbi:MAG: methionyl-tRNA formyltransferase [Alphaproteobacteria bacterium]|nr:methionyl-tRNA formyltransferase [Alphaproteobacteria bacterium]